MGKTESELNLPINLINARYNGAICSIYFYVYTYEDPKSGNTIYVGKGTGMRAWSHLNLSSNKRLNNLIQARLRDGYNILPTIVEFFESSEKALELEGELINSIGRIDLNQGTLFNLTDGGMGTENVLVGDGIEFRGELYPNAASLCRKYGVNPSSYSNRVKSLNWTMEEALELVSKEDKVEPIRVTVGQTTWPSIKKFSEETIFEYHRVQSLIKYGMTYEEILNQDKDINLVGKEVWCDGKHYQSRAAFARKISKSVRAVDYWLETGWSAEEIAEGKVTNKSGLYIEWRGTTVSQTEFSSIANLSFTSLIKYRNEGLSYEEIYRLGHRPLAVKWGGQPINYNGKTFNSQRAFNIEELGIANSTLSKWLKKFKMTAEECVKTFSLAKRISLTQSCSFKGCLSSASEIVLGKIPLIQLDGDIVTKGQLRRTCKTQIKNIDDFIKKGMTGDEIFSWSEKNRGNAPVVEAFFYEGKKFFSYSQLDRYLGIKNGLIGSFRRRGFSFEEIQTLIKNANDLMQNGVSEVKAFFMVSYELTMEKNGGRKLPPKVEEYIRLRKLGTDPKESADLSGVSKSNTSRLEKTHQKLIRE